MLICAMTVVSCGGDDDSAPTSPAADAPSTESSEVADTAAPDDGSLEPPSSSAGSEDAGFEDGAGGGVGCAAIFSMAEVEEFFAEPVNVTEESDDGLGQLVCTWETIEDPDDAEDLAFQLLIVQVYWGSPISGSNFIDPSIYESVTTIDGVGDLAFSPDGSANSFLFLDGDIGGSLDYSSLDLGDVDAPQPHTRDDVEALFRTFHERVT